MTDSISFTVFAVPQPQGSSRGFVLPGKNGRGPRAIITSANKNLKPYRQEVAGAATTEAESQGFFAPKHVPVIVTYRFYIERPPSIPKKRTRVVVKPDLDKLIRSTTDALTGILYADDAQIIGYERTAKHYGLPARVEITVRIAQDLNETLLEGLRT